MDRACPDPTLIFDLFNPDPVYEYHPLIREFLSTQAKTTLSEAQHTEVQRKAAALVEGAVLLCPLVTSSVRRLEYSSGLCAMSAAQTAVLVSDNKEDYRFGNSPKLWEGVSPIEFHYSRPVPATLLMSD